MEKNIYSKKIEAIDIFCGIGGLSYGIQKSGIKVVAGLDNDITCMKSYEKNNQNQFIHADVTNFKFNELNNLFSKDCKKLLLGCAPCQPFSSHSYKNKKHTQDDRWDLIKYFKIAIKKIEPDVISVENVRGFIKTDIFKDFLLSLKSMEYYVNYKIVFCPDYGIPQNRYRMVFLAAKNKPMPIPQTTHTTYLTVADAIKELPALKAGEQHNTDPLHYCRNLSEKNIQRITQSVQDGTWKDWDKKLLPNCYRKESGQSYTSVYGRMNWDKPSPTITTQFFNYGSGRFGHPEQNRGLSLREGALLQTFPLHYDFGEINSLARIAKHIGNAVPPRLGEVIGNQIMRRLNE